MTETEILRKAVLYAIEELDSAADFIGGNGYFSQAKHIKIDVLYKLQKALDESRAALTDNRATEASADKIR